ncbi:MAG: hypothetical protein ABIS45_15190, partial [Burkholderiales bacterium]
GDRAQLGQRQAFARDVADRAVESRDLPEPLENEDRRDQEPPRKRTVSVQCVHDSSLRLLDANLLVISCL